MSLVDLYQRTLSQAKSFEGFMDDINIAIFTSLLSHQERRAVAGDILEFGVYKGRSASIFLNALTPGESAVLVDASNHPDVDRLRSINPEFQIFKGKSENLVSGPELSSIKPHSLRVSHHDASHSFDNLTAELRFVEQRICPDGVVILDDFGNWCYSQVVAATYRYLFLENSDFEVFLISSNKAYLCRKAEFQNYANYVIEELIPDLASLGFNMLLARSDNQPGSRAFFVRKKQNSDEPNLYGLHFLSADLYKPNSELPTVAQDA